MWMACQLTDENYDEYSFFGSCWYGFPTNLQHNLIFVYFIPVRKCLFYFNSVEKMLNFKVDRWGHIWKVEESIFFFSFFFFKFQPHFIKKKITRICKFRETMVNAYKKKKRTMLNHIIIILLFVALNAKQLHLNKEKSLITLGWVVWLSWKLVDINILNYPLPFAQHKNKNGFSPFQLASDSEQFSLSFQHHQAFNTYLSIDSSPL